MVFGVLDCIHNQGDLILLEENRKSTFLLNEAVWSEWKTLNEVFFQIEKKKRTKSRRTWRTQAKQQCLPPIGCGTYWRASFISPLFSGLRVIAEDWNEKKN